MTNNYQTLSQYSGSLYGRPIYDGVEFDWEVPDNLVVGSPGGVSTIHHHYTKGFNGQGNTSSDVYAGQGQIYNAGVYGNLYQTGQEAGHAMGYYSAAPDYQFWQNQEPQQYSYTHNEMAAWAPEMKISGAYQSAPGYRPTPGIQKKVSVNEPHPSNEKYTPGGLYEDPNSPIMHHRENYISSEYDYAYYDEESIDGRQDHPEDGSMYETFDGYSEEGDFELIAPSDDSKIQNQTVNAIENDLDDIQQNQEIVKKNTHKFFIYTSISPWLLFLFFILAFIAFDFWAETAHLFVSQRFHAGGPPSWKSAVIYALLVTIAFVAIIWMAGVPIVTFDTK